MMIWYLSCCCIGFWTTGRIDKTGRLYCAGTVNAERERRAERIYMRHRIAVAFFGLLVAVNLAGAGDDPVVGEKPLSELLKQLRSENRGLQMRAAQALGNAPTNLHGRIMPQLIPILKSERENDKFVAAQTLGVYGSISRVAIPDLLPMLKGTQYERNRAAAAKALGQILKDAKSDKEVDEVTAALIEAFKDAYEDVRREAATSCGMIGPAAKACIPHLPPLLKEPPGAEPNMVSMAAAYTCERMGPLAKEHVDLLITIMHRYASFKTPAYVLALGAIGPVQDNIVPNIMDKMEQTDQTIWWHMAPYEVFERFGPKAAPAVDLLDRFLRESKLSPPQVVQTMKTLKAIGPAAKNAQKTVEGLTKITQYNQRYGRAATAEEVAEIKKQAAEALKAIAGQ
ncbi:MAG: hypothetical protein C0404_07320 [Verrucomicrobia bacterium]|nr:hypothetical protein [Verrucomicrobiota bacterium]